MTTTPSDDYFDINKFEQLLSKLEASKIRQMSKQGEEARRASFADALGKVMTNF